MTGHNQEEELTWHHQRPAQDSGHEHFTQRRAILNRILFSYSLDCKVLRMWHKKADEMFSLSIRARNLKTAAQMEENAGRRERKLHKRASSKHDQTRMMWKCVIGERTAHRSRAAYPRRPLEHHSKPCVGSRTGLTRGERNQRERNGGKNEVAH